MTAKEVFDKGLFAALMTIVVLVLAIGSLAFLRGEAILFAITNEAQVMDEKAQWVEYINDYPNE